MGNGTDIYKLRVATQNSNPRTDAFLKAYHSLCPTDQARIDHLVILLCHTIEGMGAHSAFELIGQVGRMLYVRGADDTLVLRKNREVKENIGKL
jgi:Ser/Thr protein kinase RdoA (MazF antagonist)